MTLATNISLRSTKSPSSWPIVNFKANVVRMWLIDCTITPKQSNSSRRYSNTPPRGTIFSMPRKCRAIRALMALPSSCRWTHLPSTRVNSLPSITTIIAGEASETLLASTNRTSRYIKCRCSTHRCLPRTNLVTRCNLSLREATYPVNRIFSSMYQGKMISICPWCSKSNSSLLWATMWTWIIWLIWLQRRC